MRVLNLFQDSVISCLKVLVGLGTKDKLLVRTHVFVVLGGVYFDEFGREFAECGFVLVLWEENVY